MELDELRTHKTNLKARIDRAIHEFQEATGCNPRITFTKIEIGAMTGPQPRWIIDCDVEVVI